MAGLWPSSIPTRLQLGMQHPMAMPSMQRRTPCAEGGCEARRSFPVFTVGCKKPARAWGRRGALALLAAISGARAVQRPHVISGRPGTHPPWPSRAIQRPSFSRVKLQLTDLSRSLALQTTSNGLIEVDNPTIISNSPNHAVIELVIYISTRPVRCLFLHLSLLSSRAESESEEFLSLCSRPCLPMHSMDPGFRIYL